MFEWTQAYVPPRVRDGVDYVFISYDEDDCHGPRPDWRAVFARLGEAFPRAALGFGGIGTDRAAAKAEMIRRYYGMRLDVPRFVGGWFWWDFRPDMVPATRPLWRTLSKAMSSGG